MKGMFSKIRQFFKEPDPPLLRWTGSGTHLFIVGDDWAIELEPPTQRMIKLGLAEFGQYPEIAQYLSERYGIVLSLTYDQSQGDYRDEERQTIIYYRGNNKIIVVEGEYR